MRPRSGWQRPSPTPLDHAAGIDSNTVQAAKLGDTTRLVETAARADCRLRDVDALFLQQPEKVDRHVVRLSGGNWHYASRERRNV